MPKIPAVTVYSTQTCAYCKMAKAYLKQNEIPYKEVDVGSDAKAAQEMVERSGQMGVPVIQVGSQLIIGFDKDALSKALHLG